MATATDGHLALRLFWLNRKSAQGRQTARPEVDTCGLSAPSPAARYGKRPTAPRRRPPGPSSQPFRGPPSFNPGSRRGRKRLVMLEQRWPPWRPSVPRVPAVVR